MPIREKKKNAHIEKYLQFNAENEKQSNDDDNNGEREKNKYDSIQIVNLYEPNK